MARRNIAVTMNARPLCWLGSTVFLTLVACGSPPRPQIPLPEESEPTPAPKPKASEPEANGKIPPALVVWDGATKAGLQPLFAHVLKGFTTLKGDRDAVCSAKPKAFKHRRSALHETLAPMNTLIEETWKQAVAANVELVALEEGIVAQLSAANMPKVSVPTALSWLVTEAMDEWVCLPGEAKAGVFEAAGARSLSDVALALVAWSTTPEALYLTAFDAFGESFVRADEANAAGWARQTKAFTLVGQRIAALLRAPAGTPLPPIDVLAAQARATQEGDALRAKGKLPEARAHYQRAFDLWPTHEAAARLADLLERMALAMESKGKEVLAKNHPITAARYFEVAMKLNVKAAEAHRKSGSLARTRQRTLEGLRLVAAGAVPAPTTPTKVAPAKKLPALKPGKPVPALPPTPMPSSPVILDVRGTDLGIAGGDNGYVDGGELLELALTIRAGSSEAMVSESIVPKSIPPCVVVPWTEQLVSEVAASAHAYANLPRVLVSSRCANAESLELELVSSVPGRNQSFSLELAPATRSLGAELELELDLPGYSDDTPNVTGLSPGKRAEANLVARAAGLDALTWDAGLALPTDGFLKVSGLNMHGVSMHVSGKLRSIDDLDLLLAPNNVVEGNVARRPQMYNAFAAIESRVWLRLSIGAQAAGLTPDDTQLEAARRSEAATAKAYAASALLAKAKVQIEKSAAAKCSGPPGSCCCSMTASFHEPEPPDDGPYELEVDSSPPNAETIESRKGIYQFRRYFPLKLRD